MRLSAAPLGGPPSSVAQGFVAASRLPIGPADPPPLRAPGLEPPQPQPWRVSHSALPLLHDMRQLVSEELPTLQGVRLKPAGREVDVVVGGEGDGADAVGLRSRMHPHVGEIRSERYLHLGAHPVRQRLAAAADQTEPARIDLERPARSVPLHRPRSPSKSRCWRTGRARRCLRLNGRRRRHLWLNQRHQFWLAAEEPPLDHPGGHASPSVDRAMASPLATAAQANLIMDPDLRVRLPRESTRLVRGQQGSVSGEGDLVEVHPAAAPR
jgi:hypothetical protein